MAQVSGLRRIFRHALRIVGIVAMIATLIYHDETGLPSRIFALRCATTIVGRRPREIDTRREIQDKVKRREIFEMQVKDIHFIGIPGEMRLARNHFAIHRDDIFFWVEDLGSHCGLMVNHQRISNRVMLNHGDRIHYGFSFEFRISKNPPPEEME